MIEACGHVVRIEVVNFTQVSSSWDIGILRVGILRVVIPLWILIPQTVETGIINLFQLRHAHFVIVIAF